MEIDPTQSEAVRQKSQALRTLSTGPISSSVSKLSGSSRVLPSEKDFHFYYNFEKFRSPIDEISAKSQSMLQQIGSSKHLWGGKGMGFPMDVDEEGYDWLVNVNDEVIERFDVSMDEFSRLRKAEEEGARPGPMVDETGFQLVCGKKKKVPCVSGMSEKEEVAASPTVRVAERDKKTVGPKPKVPFHIPTIKRPQQEYNILVNNSNQPFQHVWLERSDDGSRFIHPLEKLSVSDFVDRNVASLKPVKPPPLENTPFKLVEEVKDLKELATKLHSVNEFAVMHGADRDIAWLQRDFGIYVSNLFDTGQASRVLQLERNSLEYLLQHFCGVTANKEYQNADWRLRPLPDEMIRSMFYLTSFCFVKAIVTGEAKDPENSDALLLEVYKRSYDICMQLYEKELLTDTSYLYIYGVQAANLNAQQLSIAALCLLNLFTAKAKQMPLTTSKLRRLVRSKHPYVERNLSSVVSIIRHSVQNASSFEAVAEQLKEGCIQVAPEITSAVGDFPEVHTAGDYNAEGSGFSNDSNVVKDNGVLFGGIGQNGDVGKDPGFQREHFGFPSQKSEINANAMHSEKVAEASVQVLKKPNRAFGALLGSSTSKKKTDFREDLEQIKSSVSLPFYSFLHRDQQSMQFPKQGLEDQNRASHAGPSVQPSSAPVLIANSEDIILLDSDQQSDRAAEGPEDGAIAPASSSGIILLDSDSDDEAPPEMPAGNENHEDLKDDGADFEPEPELVVLDEEDEDDSNEPMSLSDLSSSFQKCLKTNQEQKTKETEGTSGLQFKPFDYEAARKEFKFGKAVEKGMKVCDDDGRKSLGKKKGGASDKSKQDEGGLPQGRRRQVFPASGNRSATFR
ncbi:hypothetical protein Cgig2_000347 [Carnegiea gigantea]|uniref:3'-5' exonuclease domain-containing protein n=1 Tax=Carnegiea gigantea TaxID=171969 RepID=A0A9Q1KBL6_9CARY|nr:hypothetical protein Cgig2_000347 [Carnegiea gigantea]